MELPFDQDLRIIPGVDLFHQFIWSTKIGATETPMQLDDVVVTGQITQDRGVTEILDLSSYFIVDEPNGVVQLKIPGAITSTLSSMVASYYINTQFPTQEIFRLCEGTVNIEV